MWYFPAPLILSHWKDYYESLREWPLGLLLLRKDFAIGSKIFLLSAISLYGQQIYRFDTNYGNCAGKLIPSSLFSEQNNEKCTVQCKAVVCEDCFKMKNAKQKLWFLLVQLLTGFSHLHTEYSVPHFSIQYNEFRLF